MEPMVMEQMDMMLEAPVMVGAGPVGPVFGGIMIFLFSIFALLIHILVIACVIIAVVSLVKIASGIGKIEGKLDDIKCELEKRNRTE